MKSTIHRYSAYNKTTGKLLSVMTEDRKMIESALKEVAGTTHKVCRVTISYRHAKPKKIQSRKMER